MGERGGERELVSVTIARAGGGESICMVDHYFKYRRATDSLAMGERWRGYFTETAVRDGPGFWLKVPDTRSAATLAHSLRQKTNKIEKGTDERLFIVKQAFGS